MQMSYEDYVKMKKKKIEFSTAIKLAIEGSADIPLIGNTIKASATKISERIENKNTLSNSIEKPENINYFVVPADGYYEEISTNIYRILELEKVQKKYGYSMEKIKLEIFEDLNDNWEVEENYIQIIFLDNEYYNEKLRTNEFGSIVITFKESFNQINFQDNRVYMAFEISSIGGNNTFNTFNRDYNEFAKLICYLLSNNKLI
ncbi:hypothetical protein [Bacillus mobilis]|uniref:hypothetical protein n=2 Tax=Bacillus TaxID=1386 RepID=UPI0008FE93CB|nr:hypothetical protein [Bacillus mobilis]OJE40767.1 hypothetical protein BAQ44_10220 [Bacillus mobilis]HDR7239605.1 hypothetical protein [Bacillus mobilis]